MEVVVDGGVFVGGEEGGVGGCHKPFHAVFFVAGGIGFDAFFGPVVEGWTGWLVGWVVRGLRGGLLAWVWGM